MMILLWAAVGASQVWGAVSAPHGWINVVCAIGSFCCGANFADAIAEARARKAIR